MKRIISFMLMLSMFSSSLWADQQWQLVELETGEFVCLYYDPERDLLYGGAHAGEAQFTVMSTANINAITTLTTMTLGNGMVYQIAGVPGQLKLAVVFYEEDETPPYKLQVLTRDETDPTSFTLGTALIIDGPSPYAMVMTPNGDQVIIGTRGVSVDGDEIRRYDISGETPIKLSGVSIGGPPATATGLDIRGTHLLVSAQDAALSRSLQIRSLANPTTLLGSFSMGASAYSVMAVPDSDYVLAGTDNSTTGDFLLLNTANLEEITCVSGVDLIENGNPVRQVYTESWSGLNDIAFGAQKTTQFQPIDVTAIDCSNPHQLTKLPSLQVSGEVKAVTFGIAGGATRVFVARTDIGVASMSGAVKSSTASNKLTVYTLVDQAGVNYWDLY